MKQRILSVLLMIFLLLLFPGCINDNTTDEEEIFSVSMSYNVESTNSDSGYLLLPILESEDKSIMGLFDELNQNGEGSYLFSESEYGDVLNISNPINFELIYLSKNYSKFSEIDAYKSISFSTNDEITDKCFCYSSFTETVHINIHFVYNYQYKPGNSDERPFSTEVDISIIGELNYGWNVINATVIKSTE